MRLTLAFLAAAAALCLAAQERSPLFGPGARRFEAREALEAFATAYPGRFAAPRLDSGEWVIALDGVEYRWADGRLLPKALDGGGEGLGRIPLYPYPAELPPVRRLAPEERARLEALLAERDRVPPERSSDLLDRLWGSPTEEAAWARMKSTYFLGRQLLVHRDLLEELAHVEAEILGAAAKDRSVAAWAEGLGTVDGYSWRPVAGTKAKSYHAYGAAIDLVPARTNGRSWYWLDARSSGLAWHELPHDKRIAVPDRVVEAFERRGFVWGGKWFFWDLVHFEYRPELLVLNGRKPLIQPRIPD